MNKNQKKQGEKHDAQIDAALAFLATEEASAEKTVDDADPPADDAADAGGDAAAAVPGDAASSVADTDDTGSATAYEFDLRALAEAQPSILLETALDAQENFIAADVRQLRHHIWTVSRMYQLDASLHSPCDILYLVPKLVVC